MVDTLQPSTQEGLAALHERMASWSLAGHWQPRRELAPLEPRLWRWEQIYTCLTEAGEVVKLGEDTGRRTVQLINPALTQEKATTRTIQMSVQLVKPGDLSRLDAAFFGANGLVSIVVFLGALVDRIV